MSQDNNNPYAPPPAAAGANPYATPLANVAREPHGLEMGELIEGGQKVDAGRGAAWISEGFTVFMQSPGTWMGIVLVYMLLTILVSLVPFLGSLAIYLLMPVMTAGMMLGCRALEEGEPLDIGHLFAGFKENVGQLVLIGLLYLAGVVVIVIGMVVIAGVGMAGAFSGGFGRGAGGAAAVGAMMILVLLAIGLSVPLMMAIWYAPALVVFHELDAVNAMKQSFSGCLKNLLPFLLYGVLMFFLSIIATLPIFLGWLVLGPVIIGGVYRSYQDIYCA